MTYITAHSTARTLTQWAGSGIKPTSSWILVGFITTEPQWEPQYEDNLFKKKWLNLNTNSGFCSVNLALFSLAFPTSMVVLKTNSLVVIAAVKTRSFAAIGEGWHVWGCPKAPTLENCCYWTCLEVSLTISICKTHLYKTLFRACSMKTAFFLKHLSKKYQCHHLTLWLPIMLTEVGANKKLTLKKWKEERSPRWWYMKTMSSSPPMNTPNLYPHIDQLLLKKTWEPLRQLLHKEGPYRNG